MGVMNDNSNNNNSDDLGLELIVSPVGDGVWEPWLRSHDPHNHDDDDDDDGEHHAVVDESSAVIDESSALMDDENLLAEDSLDIANLRVLFRQERDIDYKVADYLGIRSTIMMIQNSSTKKRKRGDPQPRPPWRMDACNRWEIGEWCYGRTFCYRHCLSVCISLTPNGFIPTTLSFCFAVIGEFSFPREFAEITMSYVDRYMSRCLDNPPSTKPEVELLALTCFYLTVKLYQTGPVLSARQMAVLSGGTYGIKEISAMEKKILFVLNWRLHPPCPTDFLFTFFSLLSTHEILSPCEPWEDQVLVLSRRMLESATLDYCIVLHNVLPSHVAAAVIIYAVSLVQPEPWVPDAREIIYALNDYSDYAMDARVIDWCLNRIRQICPTHPPVPVLTPDSTFDEDDKAEEGDNEWQPAISPNSVTTVRDFSEIPPIPCFY